MFGLDIWMSNFKILKKNEFAVIFCSIKKEIYCNPSHIILSNYITENYTWELHEPIMMVWSFESMRCLELHATSAQDCPLYSNNVFRRLCYIKYIAKQVCLLLFLNNFIQRWKKMSTLSIFERKYTKIVPSHSCNFIFSLESLY